MGGAVVRFLRAEELDAFRAFCLAAWGKPHPLIHNEAMFDYYYRNPDGTLRFAVACDAGTGAFLSTCGYLPASADEHPDVWISFLVSAGGAAPALSLRLLEFIREQTGCRTLACNNIRPKTRALYEFFGYTVAEMTHYYRLNETIENYTICNINENTIRSVESGEWVWRELGDADIGEQVDVDALSVCRPRKDAAYLQKRYRENPWFRYRLFAARGADADTALLVLREIETQGARALRVVDYLGDPRDAVQCGALLDRLLKQTGAEFCDWYAFGLDDDVMRRTGFCARTKDDANIIPNYLEPPLMENVDFTLFVSDPDGYVMCKADGDQDRPNLG